MTCIGWLANLLLFTTAAAGEVALHKVEDEKPTSVAAR